MELFSRAFWDRYRAVLNDYFEEKWNNEWVESEVLYEYRSGTAIDIRDILKLDTEEEEQKLKELIVVKLDMPNDHRMLAILQFVFATINYIRDNKVWRKPEYWQNAYTTYWLKTGDCEDMAILIYKLARLSGVPIYRMRIATGLTSNKIGHAYLLYLKEKDNRWYSLDAAYFASNSIKAYTNDIPHADRKEYGNLWWTFNEEHSWAQTSLKIIVNGDVIDG